MLYIKKWSSKFLIKNKTWVFVPTKDMVEYGNKIKLFLEKKWKKPEFYFHLRSGGHVSAIKRHKNNKYFVHLDIDKFFSQISRNRITRNLKSYTSYKNALKIASLSTVKLKKQSNTILPFGFVQSPIIASICLDKSRLGRKLKELSNNSKYKVSVYMDDIIVSSNDIVSLFIETDSLIKIAKLSGLEFNEKSCSPLTKITAFNIELSTKKIKLTEERLTLFIKAVSENENLHVRKGIIKYVSTVNTEQKDVIKDLII